MFCMKIGMSVGLQMGVIVRLNIGIRIAQSTLSFLEWWIMRQMSGVNPRTRPFVARRTLAPGCGFKTVESAWAGQGEAS
jgi:hypothetical protein